MRRGAAAVFIGLGLFLIGAQVPYERFCYGEGTCISRRLIDLTSDPHTSNSIWFVVPWYARLGLLFVTAWLIARGSSARRSAAGYVAFTGLILASLYPSHVVPMVVAGGDWMPGAVLWPLGGIMMSLVAFQVARSDATNDDLPVTRPRWSIIGLAGIGLTAAGLFAGRVVEWWPVALLYPIGLVLVMTGVLTALGGRSPVREGPRVRSRFVAIVLLVAASAVVWSNFLPATEEDDFAYPTVISGEFLTPRTTDFWVVVTSVVVASGAVLAAFQLFRARPIDAFLAGGVIAGASSILTTGVFGIVHVALDADMSVREGFYLYVGGAVLILAACLAARLGSGRPRSRRHDEAASTQ